MTKSITLNYAVAVLAAFAMVFAYAGIADAAINSSSITITTTNRGTIDNITTASAYTGFNTAQGSRGGRGGDGGAVTSDGDNNNGGATSGDGGDGGNAAAGGLVDTGNATADAGTSNDLNDTVVEVDLTTAGGDVNSTAVDVTTDNDLCDCPDEVNNIDNLTDARARTGLNTAEGSEGGNADDAGDIEGGTGDFNNGGATSGDGGDGGAGGLGGTIRTGAASSTAGTFNFLNTALVRVRI